MSISSLACVGFLYATWTKTREMSELRAREQAFLTGQDQQPAAVAPASAIPSASPESHSSASTELLQLRADVHRLDLRKNELLTARAENDRLKAELTSMATNSGPELPPDYIRTAKAQDRGFATPQATLETFFWAAHNRNLERLLQCFTPERAAQIAPGNGSQHYFDEASHIPGFRVVHITQRAPDLSTAQIEFIPGIEYPTMPAFRLVNGEWKLLGL